MKAKLIVIGGTTSATEVNLSLPTIIGRGRSAQVTIPHSLVSRQHCEIVEVDGRLVVRDLDSLNGTYVGDERITEAVLEPGALLTVGTVTFRASYVIGCTDDADATCDGEVPSFDQINSLESEKQRYADAETVPVEAGAFGESILPPCASDSGESEDARDTADLEDKSSLESAASNRD